MIKFTLIIWVCSFTAGNRCMPPITFPTAFNSWKECTIAAHKESIKIIESSEPDFFNENKVGMKYICRPDRTY